MLLRAAFAATLFSAALLPVANVQADFVRVERERVDFREGYIAADGSLYNGPDADLINQAVSDRWADFRRDYVVLRFYAVFDNPADRMVFFGSTDVQPLDIQVVSPAGRQFFEPYTNNILPPDMSAALMNTDLAFDSWLTVGAADWQDVPDTQLGLFATPTMDTTMIDGLHVPAARDGLAMVPTYDHDGDPGTPDIFNPLSLPDSQGRVLFAQITAPRHTRFNFNGSLAYFRAGSELEIERTFTFNAIPAPGVAGLLVVAGLIGMRRRGTRVSSRDGFNASG